MWARTIELMLGLWLVISPFVFEVAATDPAMWAVLLAGGAAVVILATLSFWWPLRGAHWLLLAVGVGLAVFGRARGAALSPAEQNLVMTGILLVMFAIVPSHASDPPEAWKRALDVPRR